MSRQRCRPESLSNRTLRKSCGWNTYPREHELAHGGQWHDVIVEVKSELIHAPANARAAGGASFT